MNDAEQIRTLDREFSEVMGRFLMGIERQYELARALGDAQEAAKAQIKRETSKRCLAFFEESLLEPDLGRIRTHFKAKLASYRHTLQEELERAKASADQAAVIDQQIRLSILSSPFEQSFEAAIKHAQSKRATIKESQGSA